jgi:putative intracellular protease/amidase
VSSLTDHACHQETAIPWKIFRDNGIEVDFVTEAGKVPACDEKMISGITGALLGANKEAKAAYTQLRGDERFNNPASWATGFDLSKYDLVYLAGGHDSKTRQIMDSEIVHRMLADYYPRTAKPSSKVIVAICHGSQTLSNATREDGKSVLYDSHTTGLPGAFEQSIFHATRLFLGDYYKTYGKNSDSVQTAVSKKLSEPSNFKSSLSMATP